MDQVIQIAGALLILFAFAAAQFGRFDQRSRVYLLLNLIGSAVLTVLAWHESQWGFLLLEGVWALVSACWLIQVQRVSRQLRFTRKHLAALGRQHSDQPTPLLSTSEVVHPWWRKVRVGSGAEFLEENARVDVCPKLSLGSFVGNEPRAARWIALVQAVRRASHRLRIGDSLPSEGGGRLGASTATETACLRALSVAGS